MNNRRTFLKAATVTSVLTPYWFSTSKTLADETKSKNDRPAVGSIGLGGRGSGICGNASRYGDIVAVCDVDEKHAARANERFSGGKADTYEDYRKLLARQDIDIVTIGTPDHWHVPIALHALEHGADVYCEKPLTLTIAEGELIKKAVKDSGRVFQVGTQQRSTNLFMYAVAIVRSGRLGENVVAHCGIDGAPSGGPFETSDVPEGLDWDLWLGPAAKADYSEERRRFFRWYLEYSGGKMTDWGAHHVDIAQWALDLGQTNIETVSGTGVLPPVIPDDFNWSQYFDGEADLPNAYNAATKFNIDLEFEGGKKISVNNKYESGSTSFGNGILFEGDKGRMFVNRGKLQGSIIKDIFGADLEKKKVDGKQTNNYRACFDRVDEKTKTEFAEAFKTLNKGKKVTSHMKNFFACLEDRSEPMSDVDSHVNSMNSLHMCNIALMLGRELKWDAAAQNFGSDDQANALITRKRREGFELS